MGAVAEWVKVLDWRPGGPWFESSCGNLIRLGTSKIQFTPLWQCVSEETLIDHRSSVPFIWCLCQGK